MAQRIEDYALIGDLQSAALVGVDGSIDWLCLPRFDSPSCFAALLGTADHGRWSVTPTVPVRRIRRRYRPGTLVLETEMHTDVGTVRITDFMPPRGDRPDVVRLVEALDGAVPMRMELVVRFDYGAVVPWVRRESDGLHAVAGPNAVCLRSSLQTHGEGLSTVAEFTITPQQPPATFVLSWYPSHREPPAALDPLAEARATEAWWRNWSDRAVYDGAWREPVVQSLVVLKALTFLPTGGLVAAPTTSLPEELGGTRNWDYRFCWLRDATLTLLALLECGYQEEAIAWRDWLLRAVAGDASRVQIMYGLSGERTLPERELSWLPGFGTSRPVRVGNAAVDQVQLDVFGEVMDALFQARRMGIPPNEWSWGLQRQLLNVLETRWREPDEGIWEVRGPRRHFTHSKIMAWVAFDRGIKTLEQFERTCGPAHGDHDPAASLDRWRAMRDEIHAEVCARGFDPVRGTFTQSYGSRELDASLLLIPAVGFLPPEDPRVHGTIRAVERELVQDGLVLRYPREHAERIDGLPGREGAFVACSFWLADAYALCGRRPEACALFERLLALRNDVGLLAEQVDTGSGRQLGNFPQAFSHLALIGTARNLTMGVVGPVEERRS